MVESNGMFNDSLRVFYRTCKKHIKTYNKISKDTKLPPQLIAAIHYRESGCDFTTYLHNGDPLGKPTTSVPKGKYFNNFVDAAIDALKEKNSYRKQYKLSAKSKDLAAKFSFAERYNGLGYYKRGVNSPYI